MDRVWYGVVLRVGWGTGSTHAVASRMWERVMGRGWGLARRRGVLCKRGLVLQPCMGVVQRLQVQRLLVKRVCVV